MIKNKKIKYISIFLYSSIAFSTALALIIYGARKVQPTYNVQQNKLSKEALSVDSRVNLSRNLFSALKFIDYGGAFLDNSNPSPKLSNNVFGNVLNSDYVYKFDKKPNYYPYPDAKLLQGGSLTEMSIYSQDFKELKWWSDNLAYVLSFAIKNKNIIGPDAFWDTKNGKYLGLETRKLIDKIFPDKSDIKKSFEKWATKFIELKRDIVLGKSSYQKYEESLLNDFIVNFKQKAIWFSLGMVDIWKKRYNNPGWDQFLVRKLIKFCDFNLSNDSIGKIIKKYWKGVEEEPKTTFLKNVNNNWAVGNNFSPKEIELKKGWYKEQPRVSENGAFTNFVDNMELYIDKAPGWDWDQMRTNDVNVTIKNSSFSNNKEENKEMKLIFLKIIGGEHIFVIKDRLMSNDKVAGSTFDEKIKNLSNMNLDSKLIDDLGKIAIFFPKKLATTNKRIKANIGTYLWNIMDEKFYYYTNSKLEKWEYNFKNEKSNWLKGSKKEKMIKESSEILWENIKTKVNL